MNGVSLWSMFIYTERAHPGLSWNGLKFHVELELLTGNDQHLIIEKGL